MRSCRRSWPSAPKTLALSSFVVLVLGFSAACATGTGQRGDPTAGAIVIHGAWIRLPTGGMTAAYLVIENGIEQADVLQRVTLPAGGTATLHRTTTDASGMSGMSPVDGIPVPAGGTVTLQPGGFHIMIAGLPAAAAGDMVELRLEFERAGTISTQAEVRAG